MWPVWAKLISAKKLNSSPVQLTSGHPSWRSVKEKPVFAHSGSENSLTAKAILVLQLWGKGTKREGQC